MTFKSKEIIGDATLYLGDCMEVMPTLDKVDAVLTDPPYLYLDHKLDRYFDHIEWINQVKNITNTDASLSFFGRGVSLAQWMVEADKQGFKFKEEIVWRKNRISSPVLPLGRMHELFMIFGKGKFKINKTYIDYVENCFNEKDFKRLENTLKRIITKLKNIKTIESLQEFLKGDYKIPKKTKHGITASSSLKDRDRVFLSIKMVENGTILRSVISENSNHFNYLHPTQKPINLLKKIVPVVSNKNDIVCDPFMGSGTTGVAAVQMGRKFIGIELDPDYFDIACRRIEEAQRQGDLFI